MTKTVKVRAIRPFFGVYGKVRPDEEIEVSEAHAKRYQQRGLAVPASYKMAAAPKNKMEAAPANKAAANPSPERRDGSRTGGAKPSSSSEADQASKASRSTKSKGEGE